MNSRPDHRGEPQDLPGGSIEPVDAGADHALHRIRQSQRIERAAQDRLPVLDRERSFLQEGLGDLLEKERVAAGALVDQLDQSCRHRVHPRMDRSIEPDDPGSSGSSVSAEVMAGISPVADVPGRQVTTSRSGKPVTSSATCCSTPWDASSAQCQSSSRSDGGPPARRQGDEGRERLLHREPEVLTVQMPRDWDAPGSGAPGDGDRAGRTPRAPARARSDGPATSSAAERRTVLLARPASRGAPARTAR